MALLEQLKYRPSEMEHTAWHDQHKQEHVTIRALLAQIPTAPTPVSGFGTPTGNVVINNFPGATATLLQTSETVAEILTILKAAGLIGA